MNELFIGVITALPGSGTASWDSDDRNCPHLSASCSENFRQIRTDGNDFRRIEALDRIVAALDVIEIHRFTDARPISIRRQMSRSSHGDNLYTQTATMLRLPSQ
ncbi:hypothetical protein HFO52_01220 [Rhizobium leguminosarum]|nr:hypothetical protein [Rhizobium leguminosarum]